VFPVAHSPARGGRSSSATPDLAEQRARTSRNSCRPWRGSRETAMLHSRGLRRRATSCRPAGSAGLLPSRCRSPSASACQGVSATKRSSSRSRCTRCRVPGTSSAPDLQQIGLCHFLDVQQAIRRASGSATRLDTRGQPAYNGQLFQVDLSLAGVEP